MATIGIITIAIAEPTLLLMLAQLCGHAGKSTHATLMVTGLCEQYAPSHEPPKSVRFES